MLAAALCVPLCACPSRPAQDPTATTRKTVNRNVPDFVSELKQNLGVEPAPSTFDELKSFSMTRMDKIGIFREDQEHHCCEFYFRGISYCVICYEKAQEWFEYRFNKRSDNLSFEMDDNGTLIVKNDSFSGPEGMLMPFNFRAFVDDSRKFLVMAGGNDNLPDIPDVDIEAFKGEFNAQDLVTVKEFRGHYKLDENKIDDETIEDYIQVNLLRKDQLTEKNYEPTDHAKLLEEILEKGRYYQLGYSIPDNIKKIENVRTPEEFIKDARWVYFEFEFPVPESDETKTENMLFDLKRNKVYYNAKVRNYRDAQTCEKLNEQALKSIGELPKNVGQNDRNKKHKLKYSYIVFVIDADGKFMRFSVLAKNSVNAKFDVYWKALYKECFGDDHKLDTEGFDPGKNVTRRIYGVSQDKM